MQHTYNYGRIVRDHRERKNLTIERAAELCEMSYRGYEEIELGGSNPKLSTVLKIAEALDMDVGILRACIPEKIL